MNNDWRKRLVIQRTLRTVGACGIAVGVAVLSGGVAGAATTTTTSTGATTTTTAAAGGVTPVGKVTVHVTAGNLTLTVSGAPQVVGPFTGTLTGTVTAAGKLSFPKAGISFTTVSATIIVAAQITPTATGDWSGTIDPASGAVSLSGPWETLTTVPSVGIANCPVGATTLQTSTANAGGAKYAAGKATLTNPAVPVPAIPVNAANDVACATLETTVNSSLGLPSTAGLSLAVSTTPVLTGSGTAPPTTVPPVTTPTTVAPVTTPASTPVTAAANTLPRTGGNATLPVAIGSSSLALGLAAMVLGTRSRRRQTR